MAREPENDGEEEKAPKQEGKTTLSPDIFLKVPPCPFRRVSYGVAFCTISTDAYFAEVDPLTCLNCGVPEIISKPRCRFLSLGTELRPYRGEGKLVTAMACKELGIRLYDFSTCAKCPLYSEVPTIVNEIKLNKEKAEIKLTVTDELIKEVSAILSKEMEESFPEQKDEPSFCLRCWRFSDGVCRKTPIFTKGKVTVVLEESSRNDEMYKRAIVPALKEMRLIPFRLSDPLDDVEYLCRACENIQESEFAILNLDDWDSNLIFLAGLAQAMGRRLAILKRDNVQMVPLLNLLSGYVIEYSSIQEIVFLLKHHFSPFVKRSQER